MVIKMVETEIRVEHGLQETFLHPKCFKELSYIGGGSFGKVVAAKDSVKQCDVAIKKIYVRRNQETKLSDVKNLLREVVILRFTKNPQIVELLSIYMELEEEKNPVSIYIVMKNCGENLVEYMHRPDVTLTLEYAAIIVYNIARGLNFLHKLEVYHRDLKPSNICIDVNDEKFPAKIIDLGYARKKPRDSNEITKQLATKCYRSPENLFGLKFKEKQDVWSLGCIMGYLVSSKHIFFNTNLYLNEENGILTNILRHLGKPCEAFMNDLNNENQMPNNRLLLDYFQTLDVNQDYTLEGEGFKEFFPRHGDDREHNEALKLMTGMLRWHHEERICIQDVLESDFVGKFRDESRERLPDSTLCTRIKDILDENEDKIKKYQENKDYAGLIQNYLYNYIAEDFGYDEYLEDNYSYSSRSE